MSATRLPRGTNSALAGSSAAAKPQAGEDHTSDATSQMETEVQDLLQRILGLQGLPSARLIRADIEAWDSLKHMEIVFALEDRYGVQFDEAEFPTLDATDTIASALQRHLAA